jgi:Sec-independent protein translocase protein TatA
MTDIAIILVVILVIVLIWRGPKTLPVLGQALGRGVKEARKEASELRENTEPRVVDPDVAAMADTTADTATAATVPPTAAAAPSPPPGSVPPTT